MEGKNETEKIRKRPPSSITVHVQPRREFEGYEPRGQREIPKGLLAVLITVGLLLVAGVVFIGVLLLTQPNRVQTVDKQPAATQPTAAAETAMPTASPVPSQSPVATTTPETSEDDLSSLFETPTNPILDGSQDQ